MTPINILDSVEAGADLKPLVLVYQGEDGPMHYGAVIDDTRFVVWRAAIPRTKASQALQDAINVLDDHQRR